jgi:hypothetical protein
MPCPKNILHHKLLWKKWTSEGDHAWEVDYIDKFMNCNDWFEVHSTCKLCGAKQKSSFVKAEDLIRDGYSAEILNTIHAGFFGSYWPKQNVLPK